MTDVSARDAVSMLQAEEYKMQAMEQQLGAYMNAINELRVTKNALLNLPKKETESLIPLGSSIYMTAKLASKPTILVEVGAGTLVEKEPKDAAKLIDERIDIINKNIEELQKTAAQVSKETAILKEKLTEYMKQQQGASEKNV